jgi:hypothetical protein
MDDVFELWSLPWHALQRRLAKGFGSEVGGGGAAKLDPSGACDAPIRNSWLTRARSVAGNRSSDGPLTLV